MPSISEILKSIAAKFGRREVSQEQGDQVEALKDEAIAMRRTAFDEQIRVDGVKTTVGKDQPQYKALEPEVSKEIDVFFRGITQQDFYKYKSEPNGQGISTGGEPFKCYAELDGNGNIIVTPTKMIKINSQDKENGEYTETRMQDDGTLATVYLRKVHGDIVASNFSRYPNVDAETLRRFNILKDKYSDPNNIQTLEMEKLSEDEKKVYLATLETLGIKNIKFIKPEEMTKEQYEASKKETEETGKGSYHRVSLSSYDQRKDEFDIGNCMFDEQDKPLTMSYVSRTKKDRTVKSYRRTADGKYFDTSSFRVVDGKAEYDVLEYEEVIQEMNRLGVDTSKFVKMQNKIKNDLQNAFPKEAERISDKLSRDREQREDPNKPRNDSGR